jgi:tetratricopeptide (TPR) repeat protein
LALTQTVTAALIVRDEEKFLCRCLASLQKAVDEIVVVDTGSTDRSMAIAREAGARLLRIEWGNDFAAARNVGLEAVKTDWVLYIDADECLSPDNDRRLGDYLDENAIGAYVSFRPKSGYTRYREMRLFRADPSIRFEGRIHETIWPSVLRVQAATNGKIIRTPVAIDHYGYDGDQSHKLNRNLKLLEDALQEDGARLYLYHHLAETLFGLNRHAEAENVARRGVNLSLSRTSEKDISDGSLLYQTLARILMRRNAPSLGVIEAGLARNPADYGLHYLKGCALLNGGSYAEALTVAHKLLSVDVDRLQDGLLAFDQAIFGEEAYEIAAMASYQLGNRADAATYFSRAAELNPNNQSYRIRAIALKGCENIKEASN